jgi:hypothetical protein
MSNIDKNEVLQWLGAVFIIVGHVLNAVGPAAYPYNIVAFTGGTVMFLWWTIRVANKPQMVVNVVAMAMCVVGLFKAFG